MGSDSVGMVAAWYGVLAVLLLLVLLALWRSGFLDRLLRIVEETVFSNWQLALLGGAAIALSLASGYTTFDGLRNFTSSPLLSALVAFGIQGVMLIVAWLIGWDLLLEYALIVAAVASGWAGYLQNLLAHVGIHLPVWAQGAMGTGDGRVFNVIAALVAMGVAVLLTVRTETGARLNTIVVAVKVVGVALVIGIGAFYINSANWVPFIPPEVVDANGERHFGFHGVVAAASVVFFAVFGYDTLTTAAEESRNPQRDLPRAILLSLGVSMALYLTISFVITGVAHYTTLNNDAPVANAFQSLGLNWISAAISAVAVASISMVTARIR